MGSTTEDYFINGYTRQCFSSSDALSRVIDIVRKITLEGDIEEGFSLEEKYPDTLDLRPNIFTYDDCFLQILEENNILNFIESIVGVRLFLSHVQLRVAYPSSIGPDRSYMEWHRDTHFYQGVVRGNVPPVHKIIFYPDVYGSEEQVLGIVEGSHLRVSKDKSSDYRDLGDSSIKIIKTSNSKYVLFNTLAMHSTLPVSADREMGIPRLIYNFCIKRQLEKYPDRPILRGSDD